MNFNARNIHTMYECDTADQTGANLDNTLSSSDLIDIFDNVCPITGDVYKSMKNAAANPSNLKITVAKSGDGERSDLFIEAVEFMTYLEAHNKDIDDAVYDIINTHESDIPGVRSSDIHIVFPSDSLNKNILGSQRYGKDVENDWTMQLMTGIRRYGLKANIGVDNTNK